MFERFSESARRALFFSRAEATQAGHQSIEPEHLAAGVLRALPPSLWTVWGGAEGALPAVLGELRVSAGPPGTTTMEMAFGDATQRVLNAAAATADTLRHQAITVGHLAAALIEDPDTIASRVLRAAGLTVSSVTDGAAAETPGSTQHPMGMSLLRVLESSEIQRLCDALFIATDRKDWTAARAVFSDDPIQVDMTSLAGGQTLTVGADNLINAFRAGLHAHKISHHLVANYSIAVTGNTAEIAAHGYAWNRVAALAPDDLWETWGTYRFTAHRTGAGWRLTSFGYLSKLTRGNDAVRTHEG